MFEKSFDMNGGRRWVKLVIKINCTDSGRASPPKEQGATGYPHQAEKVRTDPARGLLVYGIPGLKKLRPGIHEASVLRPFTAGPRA